MARPSVERARPAGLNALWESKSGPPLVLFFLTALVFLRAGSFNFVNYDDGQYVYENPWVKNGLSWRGVAWAFSALHGQVSYWHPVTWLSHQLDCELFGLRPGPHHLSSVWLHVANTLLLFAVLRELKLGTKAAFFVAGLFGVHPLHVESVAWIAERKDVLYGLFWLAAFYGYLRFRGDRSGRWYAVSLLCFVLSLMSKPTAVTLPVVLLLLELIMKRVELPGYQRADGHVSNASQPWKSRIAPVLPFALLSLGSSLLTILAQAKIGAVQSFALLPFSNRLDNALVSYVLYLRKTLLPTDLCATYMQVKPHSLGMVAAAVVVLSAGTWYSLKARRTRPLILFGWLWFILTLIPNIGLIQAGPQSMADRYTYLPLVGVFLMLVGLAEGLTSRGLPSPLLEKAGLAVLALFALVSFQQLSYWKNGGALFGRAVALNPDNWVAQLGLGAALTGERRFDEALPHFERAIRLPGNVAEAHRQMGLCLYWKGDVTNALAHLEAGLKKNPSSAETHFLLANILSTDPETAVRDGRRALTLAQRGIGLRGQATPQDWLTLSATYAESGEFGDAVKAAEHAERLAQRWGDASLLGDIQYRLALYRAGKPFRERRLSGRSA